MIRLVVLVLLYISFTISSSAQGEANFWYFGSNAGLDFNTGTPVPVLDGQLNTLEGCASIADASGQLLFYTDGITVWDKNHAVMPNGTGLFGNPSSTQSGIIVPRPGFPDIYYIFSIDEEAGPNGLTYSEVDISLNGGNGDVTTNKNILLITPITEKISAILHENGTDYWVVAHEWNSSNFLSFEITSTGVNSTPTTTSIGQVHGGSTDKAIGAMKFSPDGERLAITRWSQNSFIEIFDFDTSNGTISNVIFIDEIFSPNNFEGTYGIEFSPNSELLYISDIKFNEQTSKVHQLNVTLQNQNDIVNSDVIIYDGTDYICSIQTATDGKIYLANSGEPFLDIIENPNNIGTSAGYINRGLNLNNRISNLGLPPFIQSFFSLIIQIENVCLGDTTEFSIETTEEITSIVWDFGDGASSSEDNPNHIYTTPGDYTVEITVNAAQQTRTLFREITIYNTPTANIISDYIVCDDASNDMVYPFDLSIKIPEILGTQSDVDYEVTFHTSISDAQGNINSLPLIYTNISNDQVIYARISNSQNNDCYDITDFTLAVTPFPILNPVGDLSFCDDEIHDEVLSINLNMFNDTILEEQLPEDYIITYHISQEDAEANTGALPSNYQNTSNPQTFYIRIESVINNQCYDTGSFTILIEDQIIAYTPEDIYVCDDSANDSIATFDLMQQNDQIINGQDGNFVITYYVSEEDANTNTNQINTQYTNTTNPETIYARIQKGENQFCFDVTSFTLFVIPSPGIQLQETQYLCTGESIIISAENGFDSYIWSTGEMTSSITVDQAGVYTVEVIENHQINPPINCTATKTITVIESNEAVITEIEIQDWTSDENTITIEVEGIGDYEYSLDGVFFQDSNVFSGLRPGKYTAFVRDKNSCGTISEDVFLLFYPNFFTPNNDGYNDTWQVFYSNSDRSIEIFIFDRYGKLLIKLSPTSIGWDGMYNGKLMPSTDYWFKVVRPNVGEIYRGHFTLKRLN